MKNYKLLWENMPTTGEESQAAVKYLLDNLGPNGEGATEIVVPLLIQAASFGQVLHELLEAMQAVSLAANMSGEMH